MNLNEEKIKNNLEELLKKAKESKKMDDLEEFKLELDDYLEQGYQVREYIKKYNQLVQENIKLKVF
jgi:hypothetical protein